MPFEAPANFSRVSNRLFISGYNVVISEGDDDNILFVLQDPCHTLSHQCTAKAILMKAYKDYLTDNGATHVPAAADCVEGACCDAGGGPNVTFYAGTYTLSFANTNVPVPIAPLTVNVPLPITCANVFDGVSYTTAAP